MPPLQLDQPLPGEFPQPRIEGHRAVAQVIGQIAARDGQDVLDDVGGVHASGQSSIHPHRDHLAQPIAVLRQQSLSGRVVAPARPLDELLAIGTG
jgi:sirohydrochlorin ferrochelatase